ncbi:hypothetical protein ES703_90701 [subsurface metagenome]
MKKQKNYDKKVRNTRILLADYLILKSIAQKAGVSMSQALHRLIEHQAQLPMLDTKAKPVLGVTLQPAFNARSQPAFNVRSEPVLSTNGNKAGVLVIKAKGGSFND